VGHALALLDQGDEHHAIVANDDGPRSVNVRLGSLLDQLEVDFERGGAEDGYCVSCERCRDTVSGVTDCKLNGGTCQTPCTIG
jgi:hypothetical protein